MTDTGFRLRRPQLILSLCDRTGNWSQPYEDAGYEVVRVDLEHGQDVRLLELPKQQVHGILAAPPCTVFANSGARWPRTDEEMLEGLSVVDACLRIVAARPLWWALENPAGKLSRYLGPPAYTFQPSDHGDPIHEVHVPVGFVRSAEADASGGGGGVEDAPPATGP